MASEQERVSVNKLNKNMKLDINNTQLEPNHTQYLNSRATIDSMPNDFRKLSRLLSIPSNEIRLKILFLIHMEKELTTTDIAKILRISIPAISQHISKIKSLGIITARKQGQFLYYSLSHDETNIFSNIFDSIKLDQKAVNYI